MTDNDISNGMDQIVAQEKAIAKEIDEKEYDANRALEELYASIQKLQLLRHGTADAMVSVDEFINQVRAKILGVQGDLSGQRDEIVGLLDNISWSVRSVLDKIKRFEESMKKGD